MRNKFHRLISTIAKTPRFTGIATLASSILFFASSCIPENGSDPDNHLLPGMIDFTEYEENVEALPGEWEWLRTTSGFASIPETETPESTGITKILAISSDLEVQIYENDELLDEESVESFLLNVDSWGVRGDTLATRNAIEYNDAETVYIRKEGEPEPGEGEEE